MKRAVLKSCLAAFLVAALGCALAAPASAGAGSVQRFGTAGRWITDGAGRVVQLHGFNLVIKAAPYSPRAVGFGDDEARLLHRQGFNFVRLGIMWRALEPRPGVYDDAYLGEIERTFATLHRHGLAVLLDFHQDLYNERYQGTGAPDWAIVGAAAGAGAGTQAGFPTNYIVNRSLGLAFDAFWNNEDVPGTGRGVQDFFARAWAHVAKRFRGRRGLLGYNLFNEPFPGSAAQTCVLGGQVTSPTSCGVTGFEATKLTAFSRRVRDAVRRVDPRTMLWPAPTLTFDFGAHTGLRRIDANAGLAYNAYCATAQGLDPVFTYQTGKSCRQQGAETHDNALAFSRRTGGAVLNTEFGASDATDQWRAYLHTAEKRFIGWAYWTYWNYPADPGGPDNQSLLRDIRQGPRSVKRGKLRVLAHPFPSLIAGTPRSSRFRHRRLSFTYVPIAAGGHRFGPGSVTEINVPAIQYPSGYRVRASGARVISGRDPRVVRIALCPRTRRVRVRIAPGRTRSSEHRCAQPIS